MKKSNKSLLPLVLILCAAFFLGAVSPGIAESDAQADISSLGQLCEGYRSFYTSFDFGDATTIVIGHRNPDTDAVTSAIAMANLLNELGVPAVPMVADEINKETARFLEIFDIEVPEVLEDASGCQLWLVDHSAYSQAVNGAADARIVGITDHHGIGDVSMSEQIYVQSGLYGSTTAQIYLLYRQCGIDITEEMAKVMLAGLMSDTNDLFAATSELDMLAYDDLKVLSKLSDDEVEQLNRERVEAKLDRNGIDDREIFYNDYKSYEYNGLRYGIGCVSVYSVGEIEAMANRMMQIITEEIETAEVDFLIYQVYDSKYQMLHLGFIGGDANLTAEIMRYAFGDLADPVGNEYIVSPSLSRKASVVPRITSAIDRLG